jgi:hypothetical protein
MKVTERRKKDKRRRKREESKNKGKVGREGRNTNK